MIDISAPCLLDVVSATQPMCVVQFDEISMGRLSTNDTRLNTNALLLRIMTKEMREAGARLLCHDGSLAPALCTGGELAEQANNMEPQPKAS